MSEPRPDELLVTETGLVIEPVRSKGVAALLDRWEPLTEEFPDRRSATDATGYLPTMHYMLVAANACALAATVVTANI